MRAKSHKYIVPIIMLIIFETVAISLWLSKDNIFYLFNFSYIGISIALGIGLMTAKNKYNTASSRNVYAYIFGRYQQRKYANRRILVLSIYGCF